MFKSGDVDSDEVYALAKKQGIHRRTLEGVKTEIGARSRKIGDSWVWRLE